MCDHVPVRGGAGRGHVDPLCLQRDRRGARGRELWTPDLNTSGCVGGWSGPGRSAVDCSLRGWGHGLRPCDVGVAESYGRGPSPQDPLPPRGRRLVSGELRGVCPGASGLAAVTETVPGCRPSRRVRSRCGLQRLGGKGGTFGQAAAALCSACSVLRSESSALPAYRQETRASGRGASRLGSRSCRPPRVCGSTASRAATGGQGLGAEGDQRVDRALPSGGGQGPRGGGERPGARAQPRTQLPLARTRLPPAAPAPCTRRPLTATG